MTARLRRRREMIILFWPGERSGQNKNRLRGRDRFYTNLRSATNRTSGKFSQLVSQSRFIFVLLVISNEANGWKNIHTPQRLLLPAITVYYFNLLVREEGEGCNWSGKCLTRGFKNLNFAWIDEVFFLLSEIKIIIMCVCVDIYRRY